MSQPEKVVANDFIRQRIRDDLAAGKNDGKLVTRFPPEPNGYLHIGHAKSICLNFGVAEEFGGVCHLRFDDTNPEKEEQQYIESIQRDVEWLGFNWHGPIRYASGYFQQLHDYAVELIQSGNAYVCDLDPETARQYRGTLTEPGKDSPSRNRSIEENLDLFSRMKAGEFAEGQYVLRAKIDMASPNINLRDPIIYRIRHIEHHQTGDQWCIYPMYDFTHCISDAIEGITHSLCTLEFEDHRPLYDWVLDTISNPNHPQQIEFSRLELEYTITSKRKLNALVVEGIVDGWDDPRMPTIAGIRRRGYTPASIKDFCHRIGVTKSEGTVEMALLENCIRKDLEDTAPRAMGVLNPIKVVIENYPEDQVEQLTAKNHPNDESMGTRELPFTREVYIDRNDFMEVAPNKKFKRLVLDGEVRLRNAYVIKCEQAIKDESGEIIELRCSYDENTLGKNPEGRKVKGVIHWVSASHGVPAKVRLYDRLFSVPNPTGDKEKDFREFVNPDSCVVIEKAILEPSLAKASLEQRFQFEREGYFCLDQDATDEHLVFNRVVTLRDSWAKIANK
jgi:glutaminyl-tRNA synthetase